MKKFSLLMIAAAVAAVSSVFVGCNAEETDAPTITVTLNGTEQTSIEVESGVEVTIKLEYNVPGEIEQIDLDVVGGNNVTGFPMTKDFTSKTFHTHTFKIDAPSAGHEVSYTTKVTDEAKQSANKTFTIKAKAVATPVLQLWTNVKMFSAASDGLNVSAAASVDGTAFALKNATTVQQEKCDFAYFSPTLAGPGNMYSPNNISGATDNLNTVLSNWGSVKNDTKFVALTGADFDNATVENIVAKVGTPSAATAAVQLNSVVGFKTAAGKLGVFKVTDYKAGYNSTDYVTISIKVQQ